MLVAFLLLSLSAAACSKDPSENTPDQGSQARDMSGDMEGTEDMSLPPGDMMDNADAGADMGGSQLLEIENTPEGNPLVPEHPLLPFPSDFFLAQDDATRTGKSIQFPEEVVPRFLNSEMFAGIDGFSLIPPIVTFLPGGYDPDSLPDPYSPGATLEDDSPAFLLQGPSWERLPALVERDVNAETDDARALIARPLRALDPETTYVVVITDKLKRADGSPHEANAAFDALRSGTPTSSAELERERERFGLIEEAVQGQGLEMNEVVQAWSFTTRSRAGATEAMLRMQAAASEATLPEPVLDPEVELIDNDQVRLFEGTFEVDNFVREDDGTINVDEDGNPAVVGRREVEFMMTVPESVTGPRPVIVFGHGFFSKKDEITYSSFRDLCKQYGFIAVAVDFEGFDESSSGTTIALLARNTSEIDRLIAKQQQAYTHFSALARVVREHLADEITTSDGASLVIDPDQIHYMGISNGATFGAVITATSLEFTRAALVVGGGGLVHFLERAESWNALGPLLQNRFGTPLELQVVLSLLQLKLDPIDSLSYVAHLTENRFQGLPELDASLHMAVNDSSVNNMLTEIVARSAGVPLMTPSAKDIWGLDPISASEEGVASKSALVVYDEMYPPSPITNDAPVEDNGAHGSVRELDVYKVHIARFIEDGALVQVCDGACDPE
jgi:pimeloyl-ACP methyl ester carboxylesterase